MYVERHTCNRQLRAFESTHVEQLNAIGFAYKSGIAYNGELKSINDLDIKGSRSV